jgi:precorrin-6B methylase 2
MLKRVLPYSHFLLQQTVEIGDFVVDGTAGNGNDTVMLAKLVGEDGQVLSFDIQEKAIQNSRDLINQEKLRNVTLVHDSHSELEAYLPEEMKHNIGGAIFNLGYLPGSDRSIITKPDTTLKAIQTLLEHLKRNKLIVLVVYYGHEGGKTEKDQLLGFLRSLDQKYFQVLQYGFINQKNDPPFVLAIERK